MGSLKLHPHWILAFHKKAGTESMVFGDPSDPGWSLTCWQYPAEAVCILHVCTCMLYVFYIVFSIGSIRKYTANISNTLDCGFTYFYFHPEPWGDDPIWRAYFSKGLVRFEPSLAWIAKIEKKQSFFRQSTQLVPVCLMRYLMGVKEKTPAVTHQVSMVNIKSLWFRWFLWRSFLWFVQKTQHFCDWKYSTFVLPGSWKWHK